MTHMSLEQAIEIARREGNTEHVLNHWGRIKTAALYDNILDFLDDVPAGTPRVTVAKLEDAAGSLREQIARMVTR